MGTPARRECLKSRPMERSFWKRYKGSAVSRPRVRHNRPINRVRSAAVKARGPTARPCRHHSGWTERRLHDSAWALRSTLSRILVELETEHQTIPPDRAETTLT
jgi:hypothetical protein